MRLTLRTLLAYLDDTLEPSQAKLIGQKVAESDTAQELIERIKQVTRRRRLITPPVEGPGAKFDPNTVAEYLDNILNDDQINEVEEICLASDVHLAEVAACHQILTLVLGEPALVPPTTKQRMYGLVKGPEAIPFRKPPGQEGGADAEPVVQENKETDETLRLGLPPLRLRGSWTNRVLLMGGGLIAAALLVFAVWQVLNLPGIQEPTGPGRIVAQNGDKGKDKEKDGKKGQSKDDGGDKQSAKKDDSQNKGKENGADSVDSKKGSDQKKGKQGQASEIAFGPPSDLQVVLGKLKTRPETSILLQTGEEKAWKRVEFKKAEVYSGRPLVSLPGTRSEVELNKGIRLTLWGSLPEVWPSPPLLESLVELHEHDQLDLDLTLHRGRIVLANARSDGQPAHIRVRFENPTDPQGKEHFDLTLADRASQVLIDRWGILSEPFFKNPKHPNRTGPTAALGLIALSGGATLRWNDLTFNLQEPPGPALVLWSSQRGIDGPQNMPKVPDFISTDPPLPPGMDIRARSEMKDAVTFLSTSLTGREVDVALEEAKKSKDPSRRRLAVRCYGALDDLANLLDALDDPNERDLRVAAIETLRHWLAVSRDHDYKLYAQVKQRYLRGLEAEKVMELLHGFQPAAWAQPETYGTLIDYLDNRLLPIREMAAVYLYTQVPAGRIIPYSPEADSTARQQTQAQWLKLIPPGQLPPRPSKGGGKK
jgi:hypothetical protein